MKNPTTLALAFAALTLSSACGDSTPMILEVGHSPRAVVTTQDDQEVFTGAVVAPDFDDEDVSVLRRAYLVVDALAAGQLLSTLPPASDEVATMGDPGVFTLGAAVEVIGQEDVTLESITVRYDFAVEPVEFTRPVTQAVGAASGRAAFDVEFLAGEDELTTLAQALTTEAQTLGGNIITVPVTVTLEGTSSGATVRSNALLYPITMCMTCTEFATTPYALGSQR